jgi:hypothetical protein
VLWRPERVLGARGARREWSESEFLELGLVGLRKEKVVALGAGGHGVREQRRTVTSVSGRTDRVRVRNESKYNNGLRADCNLRGRER